MGTAGPAGFTQCRHCKHSGVLTSADQLKQDHHMHCSNVAAEVPVRQPSHSQVWCSLVSYTHVMSKQAHLPQFEL